MYTTEQNYHTKATILHTQSTEKNNSQEEQRVTSGTSMLWQMLQKVQILQDRFQETSL